MKTTAVSSQDCIVDSIQTIQDLKADPTARYSAVRATTEKLCEPLAIEDYVVQTMLTVSPTKWHLAHTSWFFETFVLGPFQPSYRPFHPEYAVLFNSYYNAVGKQHVQGDRGLLSRPTVAEAYRYRDYVDQAMLKLLAEDSGEEPQWASIVELGLHHEQQHQELILTDIKHVLGSNPLQPAYRERSTPNGRDTHPKTDRLRWLFYPERVHSIGTDPSSHSIMKHRATAC